MIVLLLDIFPPLDDAPPVFAVRLEVPELEVFPELPEHPNNETARKIVKKLKDILLLINIPFD